MDEKKTITKETRLMTLPELNKLISHLKKNEYKPSPCFLSNKSELSNNWWKQSEEKIPGEIIKRYSIHVLIFSQLGNKFMVEVELRVYTYEAYIPHIVSIRRTIKTVEQFERLVSMLPKLQDLYSELVSF